ncbi:hypothetical protein [Noviherbaspirillum massiliense]|uniref:hypothetical protein n=1 Tax=Noviherbaspirillum massiliense TaxID=1465823 RepID=UPI000300AE03|nr:hypothetical protein [Noviherbaspirillum massiliense]
MDKNEAAGKAPGRARDDMPVVTAWIDALRAAFGKDEIDAAIRRGLGDGTFWAMENGRIVGEPPEAARRRIEREWEEEAGNPDSSTLETGSK